MEQSENGFWETVADAGGAEWRDALERALGLHNEGAAASGAVELYRLLVGDAWELLDERQRAVAEHALGTAGVVASRSRG